MRIGKILADAKLIPLTGPRNEVEDNVVTFAEHEDILAKAAMKDVVTLAAGEPIVSTGSTRANMTRISDQQVIAGATLKTVVPTLGGTSLGPGHCSAGIAVEQVTTCVVGGGGGERKE